eukprot:GGOE01014691.1.p1 GENE.GGOE01014691.1~~GGOE01014691.1.p1  ORF type:complete len:318 (+),score=23.04 GGOE01014691.1:30-956(+)
MAKDSQMSMMAFMKTNVGNKQKCKEANVSMLDQNRFLGDETGFGPSDPAERGKTHPKRVRGDGDFRDFRMGVFKDGRDYWEHRMSNSNHKPDDLSLYSSFLKGGKDGADVQYPQVFKGLTFYFSSGCFASIPAYHLTKLVALHGGRVQPFFSRAATHVLCQNLTVSKEKELKKKLGHGRQVKFIHPDFVLDSVKSGELKPERDYLVVKFQDKHSCLARSDQICDRPICTSQEVPSRASPSETQETKELASAECTLNRSCPEALCWSPEETRTSSQPVYNAVETLPDAADGNVSDCSGSELPLFSDSDD